MAAGDGCVLPAFPAFCGLGSDSLRLLRGNRESYRRAMQHLIGRPHKRKLEPESRKMARQRLDIAAASALSPAALHSPPVIGEVEPSSSSPLGADAVLSPDSPSAHPSPVARLLPTSATCTTDCWPRKRCPR